MTATLASSTVTILPPKATALFSTSTRQHFGAFTFAADEDGAEKGVSAARLLGLKRLVKGKRDFPSGSGEGAASTGMGRHLDRIENEKRDLDEIARIHICQ
jgi:hypothetical protein